MTEIEFTKTFKFVASVDVETGAIVEVKCVGAIDNDTPISTTPQKKKPSTSKKTKKEESSQPQVILENNKLVFNTAAQELMGIEPGDRIDIGYEQYKGGLRPVLHISDKGCKLTKSGTIACKGSKHDTLEEYGTVFPVSPHDSKPQSFILAGKVTEEVDVDTELPLDIDLPNITDDEDADITELSSDFFTID